MLASIIVPVAPPASLRPTRLANPSQWGPYSSGSLLVVDKAEVMVDPASLAGPMLLLAAHRYRPERVNRSVGGAAATTDGIASAGSADGVVKSSCASAARAALTRISVHME